jgi:AraC-like DNA-binding protein
MIRPPQVLSCGRSEHDSCTPLHSHPGHELVLVESGRVAVLAGDEEQAGAPGTIFRFPIGCRHDQRNLGRAVSWYVVFDSGGRRMPGDVATMRLPDDEPLRRWIPDLVTLHLAPGGNEELESHLLAAVLARLAQLGDRDRQRRLLPPALVTAMRHLECDPLDDRDESALARLAGVSTCHLRRLFREHLGVPPGEWRRNLRLQLAQKQLRSGYGSIAEIALACGWPDANYFTRLFRSRTSMTPRAWRRHYGGGTAAKAGGTPGKGAGP